MKPARECIKGGCRTLVRGGSYCEKHAPAAKVPDRFYKTARWLRCRAAFLREHPFCNRCGELADTAHHIIEIKKGGARLDFENLESLCISCHSKEHGGRR